MWLTICQDTQSINHTDSLKSIQLPTYVDEWLKGYTGLYPYGYIPLYPDTHSPIYPSGYEV